uniref:HAT C-terminal dimerisation domain-containing protein n=1 Tax=Panagrolaimus davidi TaxID=227884 RepID=A0A914QNI7_9BILA
MVPLSIIERPGFRDFLQTVIKQSYELGIQHCSNEICSGLPGIDAILCTRNTLKKTILDTVSHLKQKFIDYVTSNINKNGGAVSTDFTVKGTFFYVITVHFITDQWDLKHYTLDFGEYGKEDSYGISVLDNFLTVMDNNGIDRNMVKKKIIITTDRGSNMINAFGEPYIRLDDTCHQLSIMSKRLYDPYKENYLPANFEIAQDIRDILSQVAETLKFCTTIITAVNSRPKLKNDLKKEGATLLQHCDVRWLTRYRSIDSFLNLSDDHKERIFDELYEHKFNNRYIYREAIDNIRQNSSLLTDYCAVVEPFNQAIRTLEAEKVCTVNKTLIQYNNLELHFKACIDRRNASPAMKAMAESGLTVLNYQRTIPSTISDYHWLGLMMDPLYKDEMSLFSNFNGQRAVTLFKNYVRKYKNASAPPQNDVDQPPSAFAAFTDTTHDLLSVECDTYLNLRSSFLRTQYENVLDFWRAEEAKYPHIAKAAKHVLSITSSSPSERVFSVTGNTLTPHRMCMSPEVTSALVNMKSLKRFEEEQKQSGLIC